MTAQARTVLDAWVAHGRRTAFHIESATGEAPSRLSGAELWRKAVVAAGVLRRCGVGPGDRVALVLPTSEALVVAMVAAWLRRAAFVLLAHGTGEGRAGLSADRLAAMLSSVRPTLVIADAADRARLQRAGADGPLLAEGDLLAPAAPDDSDVLMPRGDDVAFLQFTSGSTSLPRAVVNTHEAVLLNTLAAGTRAGADARACSVSWLPIHHDLGLLSSVVSPLCFGYRSVLIPTERFLRRPWIWLQSIASFKGTHSATPPSTLAVLSRMAGSPRLADVDLSSLRYVFVAAEPVPPAVLRSFAAAFAPRGLSPTALQPAYGLAESVVGVSAGMAGQPYPVLPAGNGRTAGLVGCGRPLAGVRVRIAGADGSPLPDGREGRILLSGPCVTRGYFGIGDARGADGWLDSGDVGLMWDGHVYVTGRTKDVLIRGGVKFAPAEIEELIERDAAGAVLRAAAFQVDAAPSEGGPRDRVVVAVETRRADAGGAASAWQARVLGELGLAIDEVAVVAPGSLPRTTSGKLQRQRAKALWLAGRLDLGAAGVGGAARRTQETEQGRIDDDGHGDHPPGDHDPGGQRQPGPPRPGETADAGNDARGPEPRQHG